MFLNVQFFQYIAASIVSLPVLIHLQMSCKMSRTLRRSFSLHLLDFFLQDTPSEADHDCDDGIGKDIIILRDSVSITIMYQGRTLAMTPPLEELVGVKLGMPAEVAVSVALTEAGVLCAALALANWSKQAEDVACLQQESIRD